MTLRLDFCGYNAARYAVTHWHYSKSMPTEPAVRIGVWEDQTFIGCVLFGRGASKYLGTAYNLPQTEWCELTRIALDKHKTPTSRIIKIAVKLLRSIHPKLRLIISFADQNQGHFGTVYQAAGWLYTGVTTPACHYLDSTGKKYHQRQVSRTGVNTQYGRRVRVPKTSSLQRVKQLPKFRYLLPLDNQIRHQVAPLVKPNPKKQRIGSADSGTVELQSTGGSASLTSMLHNNNDLIH